MGTHMKTTIDIGDALMAETKRLAASQGTTVKALLEAGLRQVLAGSRKRATPFRLQRVKFNGKGLRPELQGLPWERLRELAYEEHGA
jgi:Arc/MetJ family transcription regulator